MSSQQPSNQKLLGAIVCGYRQAYPKEATCIKCVSNFDAICDMLGVPADERHTCSNRLTVDEAAFLAERIRKTLTGDEA